MAGAKIAIDPEECRALIDSVSWYHRYEIIPGFVTPGRLIVDAKKVLDGFKIGQSLRGKRVLEIGTWDGPYAFELERRHAEVVATDIQNPDATGFNVSRRILGSRVHYIQTSVYELEQHVEGKFDIVLFLGVIYHLKHPLLALDQINKKLNMDGCLFFEGECFLHHAETLNAQRVRNRILLALLACSNIPVALSYPSTYKGARNWFIPSVACLEGWLRATGFTVERISTLFPAASLQSRHGLSKLLHTIIALRRYHGSIEQRAWGMARKSEETPNLEHHLVQEKRRMDLLE